MRKLHLFVAFLVLFPPLAKPADFKRDVVYEIVTDRFFDADASNNDPAASAGLYDPTKKDWQAYWGGDLAGIAQKLPYLADMGVTAIWISPPVDNENLNEGTSAVGAPYHGYHARDFKRIEEHFGDASNSWTAFDALVAAAHSRGIKVVVDFAPNHSNSRSEGEQGSFYDNGTLVGKYAADSNGYFHHNPCITDYNDRYQVQYYTLSDLADFNQENATVDAYLKSAVQVLQQHKVDGFRVDAIKHTTWGWLYSFANSIYTGADNFTFGEWIADSTSDALYHDLYKFANRSGFSVLDFPLYNAIDDVFARDQGFSRIDSVLAQEASNFAEQNDLVTFLDNHDRQRFLSVNPSSARLHEALAFLLTSRGVPVIYYGTEQYLHDDSKAKPTDAPGLDPFNRPWMNAFDESTVAFQVIQKLAALRKTNSAIAYGTSVQRWINNDVYVYERSFAGSVVLVAINKNDNNTQAVANLFSALPPGTYHDSLANLLGGSDIQVNNGGGNNPVSNFTLGAHTVAVWSYNASTPSTPVLASVGPDVAQSGVNVTLAGSFAPDVTVNFGPTRAAVVSSASGQLTATVPAMANGKYQVTVASSGGAVSNGIPFTVLGAKLIPVTFTVKNAAPTVPGDYIFLTGDTVELGNWTPTWDDAVGPLLCPQYPDWFSAASVPAGRTIQFKFVKIAANGTVTWENGPNHTYTVPASGTGFVTVNWQN